MLIFFIIEAELVRGHKLMTNANTDEATTVQHQGCMGGWNALKLEYGS